MGRFFRAVGCDLDGTIAVEGKVSGDVLDALAAVRADGVAALLVTGRIRAELDVDFPGLTARFDAVVTENGAVVWTARGGRALAAPVETELEEAMRALGAPVRRGEVLLACDACWGQAATREIRRLQLDCQLVYNRAALMILPAGVSEGQGLFDALGELGVSHHNMIAVGDAENDLALLEVAEVGVATGNAVPSLKTHADLVLDLPDGAGVRALLRGPFLSGQRRLCPARHWIRVGEFPDGRPVTVPGSQANILIEGETGHGKSHLAGLLAERWIEAGYSVLVLDPEGDHTALATLRGVRVVDGADRLPAPREVVALLRQRFSSVVVDLSTLPREDAARYVIGLRPAIQTERAVRGDPALAGRRRGAPAGRTAGPEHASGTCQQGCARRRSPACR